MPKVHYLEPVLKNGYETLRDSRGPWANMGGTCLTRERTARTAGSHEYSGTCRRHKHHGPTRSLRAKGKKLRASVNCSSVGVGSWGATDGAGQAPGGGWRVTDGGWGNPQ